MKVVDKLTGVFWDWFLVQRKKKNKNILMTRRLSDYVEQISKFDNEGYLVEYKKIISSPDGNYQTPISQIRHLQLLVKLIGAKKILEVGTFRGMTSMCLTEATINGKTVTCELDHDNAMAAINLWKKYGFDKRISVIEGDARGTLKKMVANNESFDFIYIDADKSNYDLYFEASLKLCRNGGLVVIDNSLWAGLVAVEQTSYSHARLINKLNQKIFGGGFGSCSLIPAWDGVTIILIK